jgi:hypothetical protein
VAVENLNIHRAFIGLTIIIIFKNELAQREPRLRNRDRENSALAGRG